MPHLLHLLHLRRKQQSAQSQRPHTVSTQKSVASSARFAAEGLGAWRIQKADLRPGTDSDFASFGAKNENHDDFKGS